MYTKERSWTNILINPRFQLKLLSYFVGLFVLSTITLYSTTYLFFWNLRNKGLGVGIPDGHVFYKFLENQKSDLDLLFLGLVAFNLVLLLSVGFIISHRIAGPIHKMKLYLENSDEAQEPLSFRQSDFFQELPPLINKRKKHE